MRRKHSGVRRILGLPSFTTTGPCWRWTLTMPGLHVPMLAKPCSLQWRLCGNGPSVTIKDTGIPKMGIFRIRTLALGFWLASIQAVQARLCRGGTWGGKHSHCPTGPGMMSPKLIAPLQRNKESSPAAICAAAAS